MMDSFSLSLSLGSNTERFQTNKKKRKRKQETEVDDDVRRKPRLREERRIFVCISRVLLPQAVLLSFLGSQSCLSRPKLPPVMSSVDVIVAARVTKMKKKTSAKLGRTTFIPTATPVQSSSTRHLVSCTILSNLLWIQWNPLKPRRTYFNPKYLVQSCISHLNPIQSNLTQFNPL